MEIELKIKRKREGGIISTGFKYLFLLEKRFSGDKV